jgi:hypothetical protein
MVKKIGALVASPWVLRVVVGLVVLRTLAFGGPVLLFELALAVANVVGALGGCLYLWRRRRKASEVNR